MLQAEADVQEEIVSPHLYKLSESSLFSFRSIRVAVLGSVVYLLISYLLIGFKTDQLFLVFLFNSLYFASATTRRFILGFSVFILYWIVFDYMKAFPNFRYSPVHIASLYNLEKSFFGFNWNDQWVTPNEFFAQNHTTFLDILSGFFYLCWIPVPLLFAGIMFFKNRTYFFQFALTFFLVNLIGFAGYYMYPAAPPWYVAQKGFEFVAATPGNTAGLARFDALFGVRIFAGIYSKSSNVFAAMPSLHAAYMMIVVFYSIKARWKRLYTFLFAFIMLGIWFTAVYSSHHYILDILAGIACAVLGIALIQYFFQRSTAGKHLVQKLVTLTSR